MVEPLFPGRAGVQRWPGPRQALAHMLVAVLALAVAGSLPASAAYILYVWWPRLANDPDLLVATEIAVAGVLVLLLNVARVALVNRRQARVADAAALVYARGGRGRLERWRERQIVKRLPAARDACILALTGYDTFADPASLLHRPLAQAYEVRAMLLDPAAAGARRRVNALPRGITLSSFAAEVDASIAYLARLRGQGKRVELRFCEREPFWKVAVLGDYVWVQYCHSGFEVKHEPEYVFGLNRASLRRGLFVPFYMYFLEQWKDASHPYYDFDTQELVCRDDSGREISRRPFGVQPELPT